MSTGGEDNDFMDVTLEPLRLGSNDDVTMLWHLDKIWDFGRFDGSATLFECRGDGDMLNQCFVDLFFMVIHTSI